MYVLGIHQGHDSSVSLVKEGKMIASAAEERFVRIKHYGLLPLESLLYCLQFAKIDITNIDLIVFPSLAKNENVRLILERKQKAIWTRQDPEKKKSITDYLRLLALETLSKLELIEPLQPPAYVKKFPYPQNKKILHIDHHLAHAASAYFASGFQEKTLVVTADGSGDGLSTTVWIGEKGKLTAKLKLGRESSLGAFYGLITEALGWWVGDGEGKTMGLAPYGSTKKTRGLLNQFVPKFKKGKLVEGFNWGFPGVWEDKGAFHFHFRDQMISEIRQLVKKYGWENVAAEAQRLLEEQLLNLIIPWIKKEKVCYLAAAGGVFLNVKANQRIWEKGWLKDFFVFPDAGDGGIATGAALYGYYLFHPKKFRETKQITNAYWGPEYSLEEIEAMLKVRKIKYSKANPKQLSDKAARLLAQNKTVAIFSGRMESGPRALGNRSILMSPLRSENKDILNKTIKYRELFRPFCPTLINKSAKIYLEHPTPNPAFMIFSFNTPKDKIKDIPAVVHVDGTSRPQVIKRNLNPFYYDVIKKFGEITGIPVILNTSFNIRGEPIICSPQDALKCFYDTGLDSLIYNGRILLSK